MTNKIKFKGGTIGFLVLFLMGIAGNVSALDVGVAWVGKSGMSNSVISGFEKGISEIGPDIHVEYVKELPDLKELSAVVERFHKEKPGMVILRSNGAKWLAQNPPAIPTFIGGCNHPVQLGVLKNMQAPEGKITGVTCFLPVATPFEIFNTILPVGTSVETLTYPLNFTQLEIYREPPKIKHL